MTAKLAPATLSAPATVEGAPVFIPTAHRKAMSAGDVPALAARYIVGADDALVRPSDIRLSVSVLKAGMGGKPSLDSFINGLAGIAARLAWGAIRPDQACEGLPDFAAWAIQQADKAIISRKGISAGLLRALVADVVTRTAALPVRTATKKADKVRTLAPAAVPVLAPAADVAAVDRTAALAELARMTRAVADAPINTRDALPHRLADEEQADALGALAASAARIKAEQEQASGGSRLNRAKRACLRAGWITPRASAAVRFPCKQACTV